jgi:hypothetical protein
MHASQIEIELRPIRFFIDPKRSFEREPLFKRHEEAQRMIPWRLYGQKVWPRAIFCVFPLHQKISFRRQERLKTRRRLLRHGRTRGDGTKDAEDAEGERTRGGLVL